MKTVHRTLSPAATVLVAILGSSIAAPTGAQVHLGPEEIVTSNGVEIDVPGYSVPSFAYWNSDSLPDLIVGEGGGGYPGMVRVYLNSGTPGNPQFTRYLLARSNGVPLVSPGSG